MVWTRLTGWGYAVIKIISRNRWLVSHLILLSHPSNVCPPVCSRSRWDRDREDPAGRLSIPKFLVL